MLLALLASVYPLSAQDNIALKSIFWGERLIDQQTAQVLQKKIFKVEILHRFGTIENGFDDLFGVYAPSNISMGLGYGITSRLMVEFQTEKNHKTQELGLKYRVLRQSINNEMPINLSYYFNTSVDARDENSFGENYTFTDRLFFTNQVIASHQFKYKFNALAALSYVHFNAVPEQVEHDKMELNLAAAYKISRKHSVFINYQQPWDVTWFSENINASIKPKSSMAFGYESATFTHNFQVFMSTRDNIIPGKDMVYNQNPIALKNLRLGFNIRVYIGKRKAIKNQYQNHDE